MLVILYVFLLSIILQDIEGSVLSRSSLPSFFSLLVPHLSPNQSEGFFSHIYIWISLPNLPILISIDECSTTGILNVKALRYKLHPCRKYFLYSKIILTVQTRAESESHSNQLLQVKNNQSI